MHTHDRLLQLTALLRTSTNGDVLRAVAEERASILMPCSSAASRKDFAYGTLLSHLADANERASESISLEYTESELNTVLQYLNQGD